MTENDLKEYGKQVMTDKKQTKSNIGLSGVEKWNDAPLYANNLSPREEVGYSRPEQPISNRPQLPWARNVISSAEKRQPYESPFKEWWKSEQSRKLENK